MSFLQAILLGLIQGITEFIPVSSSGHMAVVKLLTGGSLAAELGYEVFLHLATLIAVVILFRKDIRMVLVEMIRILRDAYRNLRLFFYNRKTKDGKRYYRLLSTNYRKLAALIFVSSIPTAVLGFLLRRIVLAAHMTFLAPGIGLLTTGILLYVVDYVPAGDRIPRDIRFYQALIIGICQGFCVLPGLSRCGVTITVGLLCGFRRNVAVKYSYLLSIPAILGASLVELPKIDYGLLVGREIAGYLCGGLVAFLAAFLCIRTFLNLLQKRTFRKFAYYCFCVGVAIIVMNFI